MLHKIVSHVHQTATAHSSLLKKIGLGALAVGAVGLGVVAFERKAKASTPDGGGLAPAPSPRPPAPRVPVVPAAPPPGSPNIALTAGQTATVVAPSGLNLRSGPGTSFQSFGVLQPGATVLVLDASRGDGWVQVQTPDHVGFMCNTCEELNATGTPIGQSLLPKTGS